MAPKVLKKPSLKKPASSKAPKDSEKSEEDREEVAQLTLKDFMEQELNEELLNPNVQEDVDLLKVWSLRAVRVEVAELYMQARAREHRTLDGFCDFMEALLRTRLRNGEFRRLLREYNLYSMQQPDD